MRVVASPISCTVKWARSLSSSSENAKPSRWLLLVTLRVTSSLLGLRYPSTRRSSARLPSFARDLFSSESMQPSNNWSSPKTAIANFLLALLILRLRRTRRRHHHSSGPSTSFNSLWSIASQNTSCAASLAVMRMGMDRRSSESGGRPIVSQKAVQPTRMPGFGGRVTLVSGGPPSSARIKPKVACSRSGMPVHRSHSCVSAGCDRCMAPTTASCAPELFIAPA